LYLKQFNEKGLTEHDRQTATDIFIAAVDKNFVGLIDLFRDTVDLKQMVDPNNEMSTLVLQNTSSQKLAKYFKRVPPKK
jgi:hypothetical protein